MKTELTKEEIERIINWSCWKESETDWTEKDKNLRKKLKEMKK